METTSFNPQDQKVIPTSRSSVHMEKQNPQNAQKSPVEPSGNVLAYLQVLGAFFLMFNTWGITNTFGAYQTYYEENLLQDQSPSRISWIGSIQAFLMLLFGGLLTGPIFDAGYLRGLVVVGSIAAVFGMMMTSLSKEYWQVVLAQGVCVGIGAGCLLLPSIAVMPQYFTKRRSFATGIATAGSSIGGVIYPTIFHQLQPRIGFGWATRVIAFVMFATLMIPVTVMRAKSFPSVKRPFFDFGIIRRLPYDFFTIGMFFGLIGLYIPFYYMPTFCVEKGLVDENLGFYLLALINSASVFGRIVPNFFADMIGPLNISTPFCFLCGIMAFCWTSVSSTGQAIAFCIFYGFFSGTFVAIIGPALVSLCPDLSLVGTHMGMSFGFSSLGLLIGNPIAGILLVQRGWIGLAVFCGTSSMLAACFMLMARINNTGTVLMVKA